MKGASGKPLGNYKEYSWIAFGKLYREPLENYIEYRWIALGKLYRVPLDSPWKTMKSTPG
jgi:hypothetical protein